VGSTGRNAATGIGGFDGRAGASAACRQPELGSGSRPAHPRRAADVGLGPTRAFVGCAAGRCARQHADIDLGRAAPGRSDVSGLGRARRSATTWSAGSSAASAAGRGSAASSASGSHAASSSSAAACGRAAAARACVAASACCPGRFTGSTASVVGGARRRAARLGPSGRRRTCHAAGRTRAGVERARRAARVGSSVELLGGARRACALNRTAVT